jgi:hypothetical protein
MDSAAAPDSGTSGADGGGGSPDDTGAVVDTGSTGEPEAGGVDNPSCCVATASDDSMCTSRGEPGNAYVCFCPDGGIDPTCTINQGTELVCCP